MDKIEKALKKLSTIDRNRIKQILTQFKKNNIEKLDIKKLKGRDDIFRIHSGNIRIIYRVDNNKIFILSVARRNEKTYKLD